MKIPLLNLPAQYKELSREIDAAVKEVMLSAYIWTQVKTFEDTWSSWSKVAVAVASVPMPCIVPARAGHRPGR